MGFDPLAYAFGAKGSGYPAGRDLVSYLMGKNAAGGAYHEFSGSIIRFLASKAAPIRSIIASIAPVQDLHGYANPWAGGAGKNLFPTDFSSPTTINSTTITKLDDGRVTTSGVPTGPFDFVIGHFALAAGTYILNGAPTGGGANKWRLQVTDYPVVNSLGQDNGNGVTFTLASDMEIAVRLQMYVGASASLTFAPMIRLSSISDGTFAPYSNICPISGWTEANVFRTGVNIWTGGVTEQTWISDISGTTSAQSGYCVTDYIPIVGGCSYYKSKNDSGRILFFDRNYQSITTSWNVMSSGATTFTAPSNAKYIRVTITNAYKDSFCINYPATDESYHAYTGTSLTIPFVVNGDTKTIYGGTVSVDADGKVKLTATSVKIAFLATGKNDNYLYTTTQLQDAPMPKGLNAGAICNRYKIVAAVIATETRPFITLYANGIIRWVEPDFIGKTYEEYNTMMGDNRVEMVYDLAEPVEYDLADVTVLSTLVGTNVMWTDCDGLTVEAKGNAVGI